MDGIYLQKDRASHAYRQLAISPVYWSRFQTDDSGLWSGNETLCVHAYKIRKWRPRVMSKSAIKILWDPTVPWERWDCPWEYTVHA